MRFLRTVGVLALLIPFRLAAVTFTVTNSNDSGAGSLRQAILDANTTFAVDDIAFAIPGSGVHTIALASALPPITRPVLIDGYTQPGSSANTQPTGQGLNTVLTIEIDGTGAGNTPCVTVNAGNTDILAMVIQGLVINRCVAAAIRVGAGGDGAVIIGNFLGTDPAGGALPGPQARGVDIEGAGAVVIGGSSPFERNLISGNHERGVSVGPGGDGSAVRGNLIGTNAAGTALIPLPPGAIYGVTAAGNSNVTIGGPTSAHRNVISGTYDTGVIVGTSSGAVIRGNFLGTDATGTQPLGIGLGIDLSGPAAVLGNVVAAGYQGIFVTGGSDGSVIQGNFIGTDESATRDLGNSADGIFVANSDDVTIGGLAPGEGNVIAYNGRMIDFETAGIQQEGSDSVRVRIRGNRIFANVHLGYDQNPPFGVTPNDTGDGDSGANQLQNYPIITSVVPGASTTHIEGRLNSAASTTFDVDLYSSGCLRRPHDFLQGETYLGSVPVVTNGSGNGTFATDVPFVLPAGQSVTATATDPTGNTSEFSQRIVFSLDPPSGPAGGGVASTLTGMLFEPGATVTVGGISATNVNVVNPTTITATMPARPAGSVNDVTALDPSGILGTLRNGWVADFLDVPEGQQFHDFVVPLVANGVTAGVGGGLYGVNQATLRQQMAVFLLKAKHGACYVPPPCTGVFPDVPCGPPFADWIEALFAEGITGGCGGGNYCPQNPVRRDQMAVFLLKTSHGSTYVPPACVPPGVFPDVPCPGPFTDWIEQLAAENITGGCGGGNYCPGNNNTRGQMAVFIVKTFDLQ